MVNHHLRKVSDSHENANHLSLPWDNLVDVPVRVRVFVCFRFEVIHGLLWLLFFYAWALNLY